MLLPQTIIQRKLLYLRPSEATIKLDFSSEVSFVSLYGLAFNLYYACKEYRVQGFSPIVDIRIKGVDRLRSVPCSILDLSQGFDHSLPLNIDTQTEQAVFEVSAKYHELFPKVKDLEATEQSRLKAAPYSLDDEAFAGDITLEFLLFGYSSLS